MFALWFPTVDSRTIIILFPFAIAVLIAILAIFYWSTQHSQTQKVITKEGRYYKCPMCGEKLYVMGNNDFKCSRCGEIIPYRSIAEA